MISKDDSKRKLDFTVRKHLAFKFMYNGRNYDGLVTQTHTTNTIEQFILNAIKKANLIDNVHNSNFARCGRTDAGVSSTGNVFSIHLRQGKTQMDYVKIINNLLPDDIMLVGSAEVDDSFDARFSCLYREYKYFFIRTNLNVDMMIQACAKLEGVHNFKNFCKIDKSDQNYLNKNYERRIYDFSIEKCDQLLFPCDGPNNITASPTGSYFDMYCVTIRGSAFLWHQVRCMMGILFLIGKGLEDVGIIDSMFDIDSDSNKAYNFEIASEIPLLLSDCQFEGVGFTNTTENLAENFFSISKIYEQNLTQIAINSFFFRCVKNLMVPLINTTGLREDVIDVISNQNPNENEFVEYVENKYRRKKKYTKLLNHKVNRDNKNKK